MCILKLPILLNKYLFIVKCLLKQLLNLKKEKFVCPNKTTTKLRYFKDLLKFMIKCKIFLSFCTSAEIHFTDN